MARSLSPEPIGVPGYTTSDQSKHNRRQFRLRISRSALQRRRRIVATAGKTTESSAQQSVTSTTAQSPAVNLQKESVATPDKTPKTPTQQPVASLTAQGTMFNTPKQPVATSAEASNSSAKQPVAKNPSPKSLTQAAELARDVTLTHTNKVILGPRRHAAIIQCAANVLAKDDDNKFDIPLCVCPLLYISRVRGDDSEFH